MANIRVIEIKEDYRLRLPGETVIVGDRFYRKDGFLVEVVKVERDPATGRESFLTVPVEVMELLGIPSMRYGIPFVEDGRADRRRGNPFLFRHPRL